MDRVFKRVAEGIVAFDALYDKVQQSTNQSQKEKLEQVSTSCVLTWMSFQLTPIGA
jgi:CCR4-NOT transcriptional regulation complex NOT5 subunit